MKMCMPHWQQLRTAIDERDLGDLVSKDGATAAKRIADASDGLTVANFDPLMDAYNRLLGQFVRMTGLHIFTQDDCPVCFANRVHNENCTEHDCTFSYDPWIENAADEAKQTWDEVRKKV